MLFNETIFRAFCLIAVLGSTLNTAQAVELINQCQTIDEPGSYRLTNNLNAVGDCLIVTTDHVTIDLGGHVIQGDNSGDGVVDDRSFRNGMQIGLVVRNGTVTGFRFGIAFDRTVGAVIENVTVSDNTLTGISITAGIVSHNLVFRNGGDGIEADRDSIVNYNQVMSNGRDGIEMVGNGVMQGNTVNLNEATGMRARGTGVVLVNNSSTRNRDYGVSVVCPSVIIGNAMNRNNLNRNESLNFRRRGSGCVISRNTQ